MADQVDRVILPGEENRAYHQESFMAELRKLCKNYGVTVYEYSDGMSFREIYFALRNEGFLEWEHVIDETLLDEPEEA